MSLGSNSQEISLQVSNLHKAVESGEKPIGAIDSFLDNEILRNATSGSKEVIALINIIDQIAGKAHQHTEILKAFLRALRKICSSHKTLPSSCETTLPPDFLDRSVKDKYQKIPRSQKWEIQLPEKVVGVKLVEFAAEAKEPQVKQVLYKELVIWRHISRHPNIVPFIGMRPVEEHKGKLDLMEYDATGMYLVSDWMTEGNLAEYTKDGARKIEHKNLLLDICQGLKHLHSLEVSHGNLKGTNILIDTSRRARLVDFGLSSLTSQLKTSQFSSRKDTSDKSRWIAPEILGADPDTDEDKPTFKSDIYSLGMVIYEVVAGKRPLDDKKTDYRVAGYVLGGGRPERPNNTPDEIWNLMQTCWQEDPAARPEIGSVLTSIEGMPTSS